MGTPNDLNRFLKSLCNDSQWSYAVFWKLEHQMLLTYEDGYYGNSRLAELVTRSSDKVFTCKDDICLRRDDVSVVHERENGDAIGLAAAEMSGRQYTMGEGVVGKVAYTGWHYWVLYNDNNAGLSSSLITKYPNEWLLQFAAGIKTIVLVPVVPHGVLQLGSLEAVSEDLALVIHIQEIFSCSQKSVITRSLDRSEDTRLPKKSDYQCLEGSDRFKPIEDNVLDFNQGGTCFHEDMQSENLVEALGSPRNSIFDMSSENLDVSINIQDWGKMESKMFQVSCFQEDMYKHGKGEISQRTARNSFQFPSHCELHKAFAVSGEINGCSLNSSDKHAPDSSLITKSHLSRVDPLTLASNGSSSEVNDVKELLEPVVADDYSGFDDAISYRSSSMWSSMSSKQETEGHHVKGDIIAGNDFLARSHVLPAFVARGSSTSSNSSTSASSMKSMISAVTNWEPQKNGHSSLQHTKLSRPGKRKARTSDGNRPRPRDRQMIQERIKELRNLVPDGSKCSIDSLLDRTIKHMLFLTSASVQCEKLRQLAYEEVTGRSNHRPSKEEYRCKNGISWAVELGTEVEVCPIVVEDLEHPGHLLIKMLCDDHGLFLEIAQVIRSLELTILKGVMEYRVDDTWAHFVVESSIGVQRVNIFWPLLHLLQRKK